MGPVKAYPDSIVGSGALDPSEVDALRYVTEVTTASGKLQYGINLTQAVIKNGMSLIAYLPAPTFQDGKPTWDSQAWTGAIQKLIDGGVAEQQQASAALKAGEIGSVAKGNRDLTFFASQVKSMDALLARQPSECATAVAALTLAKHEDLVNGNAEMRLLTPGPAGISPYVERLGTAETLAVRAAGTIGSGPGIFMLTQGWQESNFNAAGLPLYSFSIGIQTE